MRRFTRSALPLAVLLLFAACSGDDRSTPTGPGTQAIPEVPNLDQALSQTSNAEIIEAAISIQRRIDALYPRPSLLHALASLQFYGIVVDVIHGNTARAQSNALQLIAFTLRYQSLLLPRTNPEERSARIRSFSRALLDFVGFEATFPFDPAGGDQTIAIVGPAGGLVQAEFAGVSIPPGALSQNVVVAVSRLPDPAIPREGPLPGNQYDEYPLFYDFTTVPHVPRFNVPVRIGVCQVEDPGSPFYPPEAIHDRLRLAHPDPANPAMLEIPPKADVGDFLDCGGAAVIPVGTPGIGFFDDGLRSLRRFASHATALFTPNVAYAGHGGLGSLSTSFSPWGAVDPCSRQNVCEAGFRATFGNETVGAPPTTPEIGTWTLDSPAGRIVVREAVGDLTAQPVELTQFGEATGGVRLTGRVAGTPPVSGMWDASWRSVAADPSVFFAPVVIRDIEGLIVASLEYRPDGQLTYNNAQIPASWTPGISQQFTIRVNLGQKVTSLLLNGVPVEGAQNVPFYQLAASSIATIGFELGGTFAQRFGWDDISIAPTAVIE